MRRSRTVSFVASRVGVGSRVTSQVQSQCVMCVCAVLFDSVGGLAGLFGRASQSHMRCSRTVSFVASRVGVGSRVRVKSRGSRASES